MAANVKVEHRSRNERSDIRDFHIFLNPAHRGAHAGYMLSS
jgi:hypothetical protein